MQGVLRTSRLRIRLFEDKDLEPFLQYRNDAEVARYQGWQFPYPRGMAEFFLQEMKNIPSFAADADFRVLDWYQYAVALAETDQLIGDVAVNFMSGKIARLGYTIARPFWGKGYATEAVVNVTGYLFGVLGLHRVVADCSPANIGSVRVLEKAGFRREGHFVESYEMPDGSWDDEYLYAILRREWKP